MKEDNNSFLYRNFDNTSQPNSKLSQGHPTQKTSGTNFIQAMLDRANAHVVEQKNEAAGGLPFLRGTRSKSRMEPGDRGIPDNDFENIFAQQNLSRPSSILSIGARDNGIQRSFQASMNPTAPQPHPNQTASSSFINYIMGAQKHIYSLPKFVPGDSACQVPTAPRPQYEMPELVQRRSRRIMQQEEDHNTNESSNLGEEKKEAANNEESKKESLSQMASLTKVDSINTVRRNKLRKTEHNMMRMKREKGRQRIRKTPEQLRSLEDQYTQNANWDYEKKTDIALELDLTFQQVSKWHWDRRKLDKVPNK